MTPEQAFAEIAAKHDLTYISIGMNMKQAENYRFGATVHWDGMSRRGCPCVLGHGPDTVSALLDAVNKSIADRIPFGADGLPVIDVELAA